MKPSMENHKVNYWEHNMAKLAPQDPLYKTMIHCKLMRHDYCISLKLSAGQMSMDVSIQYLLFAFQDINYLFFTSILD